MEKANIWYKNAVIYQLHVKSFRDSNGDGIGDFKGLATKLNYIQDLGCTAIWLLPFYPSPLKDDGYDIADYRSIHPHYGTLQDFRHFLNEAHRRNIKIITELVINHTSDQHAWFQHSRAAKPGDKWRDYYVWSDSPQKYAEARIIFKDFETSNWTWDPVANAYYWHRFYSCQPDLNYDNPEVQAEIFKIMEFWLDMGVDGMRLDAIPYLYQREGTDCENLPETHAFLKKLRAFVDSHYTDRMLLAEANQWPEQTAAYFGNADECHMAFHFPVMPRLFMSLQMEDRFPIIDIMEQTPAAPDNCQWAIFLRNHDELTLEMVTDEERGYMYRAYAKDAQARINLGIRRRLAPLLENNRQKIELLNILLFSLPGSPIIYYGDEIGMGDNYYLNDRNGVRTPMQWDSNANAGFSEANPQKLFLPLIIDPQYHYTYVNVQNQEFSTSSHLKWMRSAIATRHRHKAFGCGTLKFLHPSNHKILAFIREYAEETILVIVNLSKHAQYVALDLQEYNGFNVKDLFSENAFYKIGEQPYGLTLSRYGYYWLSLEPAKKTQKLAGGTLTIHLQDSDNWKELFSGPKNAELLQSVLPQYLQQCRWYRGKSKALFKLSIVGIKEICHTVLATIEAHFCDETFQTYLLPITCVPEVSKEDPQAIIARIEGEKVQGFLIDAIYDETFRHALLHLALDQKQKTLAKNSLCFSATAQMRRLVADFSPSLQSIILKGEQSNTSIVYNDAIILKLYRYLEEGINPDLQMTKFLSEEAHFQHIPEYLGSIESEGSGKLATLALFQKFIPQSEALWLLTLDALDLYFKNTFCNEQPLANIRDSIGLFFLDIIRLLGQRTGELHLSLANLKSDNKEILPEPFTPFYQKSLYQGMRSQLRKVFATLRCQLPTFDHETQSLIVEVLSEEQNFLEQLKKVRDRPYAIKKIRIHGDFHLGQALFNGKDVTIIDFEGEPILPLSERHLKRSALQDIASMIRSFHYAVTVALCKQKAHHVNACQQLETLADSWYRCISNEFLNTYLDTVNETAGLLPANDADLQHLLNAFLLHKAVYETNYELHSRPEWIKIPLKGMLMLNGKKQ